jgi:alpha-1,2-mannosyltransferase
VHNVGFQTWEQSPEYGVRSWFYVLLHAPLAYAGPWLLSLGKRQQFFALRMCLGAISSACEAAFFRAVVEAVNERVGRYLFFAMALSAGMFSASVAFLPSSFAMYANMLAASFWFHPATTTDTGVGRAFFATVCVAIGAIVGWPFAAVLGVPFVIEYALLPAGEVVPPEGNQKLLWGQKRLSTLVGAIVVAAAAVAIPTFAVDSWAYGRFTFPTLNIVLYNVFGENGPDLYGTEPFSYYFKNLFLNFNFLLPLALISLPALAVTYKYDFRRLGKTQQKPQPGETSPYTLMVVRLAPFYLWLAIFTMQPHKEERFMFPAYPFLCFNACVSIFLIRGWFETIYVNATNSPYRAAQSDLFSWFTFLAVIVPSVLSLGRVAGQKNFYGAPMAITNHFQYKTLPSVLEGLGYEPIAIPSNKDDPPVWDLSPFEDMEDPIRVCYGAEWHRFPSSFLFPKGIDVQWIQGAFDGMMPRHWDSSSSAGWWPRSETRAIHLGRFNSENKASAEPGTFVPVDTCNYLVTLNLPSQPPTKEEPDYVSDPAWEVEFCTEFLDAASSSGWARWIWLPGGVGEKQRVYGQYCLLRRAGETV